MGRMGTDISETVESVTLHPVDKVTDIDDSLDGDGDWILMAYDADQSPVVKRRVGPLTIEGTYLGVPDDDDPRQRTAHDVIITVDEGTVHVTDNDGIIIESENPTIRLGTGFVADRSSGTTD